jgi:hypothetical protein
LQHRMEQPEQFPGWVKRQEALKAGSQ